MGFAEAFVVTLGGSLRGTQTRNVFQYEVQETFPDVEDVFPDLLNAFERNFFLGETDSLNGSLFFQDMLYQSLDVYSLADPTPFLQRAISYAGAQSTGEGMPSFNAYALRSAKLSRGIRRGQKRFAGVSEVAVNGDQVITSYKVFLDGLAVLLGDTISDLTPSPYTFVPVVIKRVQYITPKGTLAYRFPESVSEYSAFDAVQWEARSRVSSQVSRKAGVGI